MIEKVIQGQKITAKKQNQIIDCCNSNNISYSSDIFYNKSNQGLTIFTNNNPKFIGNKSYNFQNNKFVNFIDPYTLEVKNFNNTQNNLWNIEVDGQIFYATCDEISPEKIKQKLNSFKNLSQFEAIIFILCVFNKETKEAKMVLDENFEKPNEFVIPVCSLYPTVENIYDLDENGYPQTEKIEDEQGNVIGQKVKAPIGRNYVTPVNIEWWCNYPIFNTAEGSGGDSRILDKVSLSTWNSGSLEEDCLRGFHDENSLTNTTLFNVINTKEGYSIPKVDLSCFDFVIRDHRTNQIEYMPLGTKEELSNFNYLSDYTYEYFDIVTDLSAGIEEDINGNQNLKVKGKKVQICVPCISSDIGDEEARWNDLLQIPVVQYFNDSSAQSSTVTGA